MPTKIKTINIPKESKMPKFGLGFSHSFMVAHSDIVSIGNMMRNIFTDFSHLDKDVKLTQLPNGTFNMSIRAFFNPTDQTCSEAKADGKVCMFEKNPNAVPNTAAVGGLDITQLDTLMGYGAGFNPVNTFTPYRLSDDGISLIPPMLNPNLIASNEHIVNAIKNKPEEERIIPEDLLGQLSLVGMVRAEVSNPYAYGNVGFGVLYFVEIDLVWLLWNFTSYFDFLEVKGREELYKYPLTITDLGKNAMAVDMYNFTVYMPEAAEYIVRNSQITAQKTWAAQQMQQGGPAVIPYAPGPRFPR